MLIKSLLTQKSSAYNIDEVVFESSTAGTTSLDLLETGKYEVICVAGGGGAQAYAIQGSYSSTAQVGTGASGACFKGIVELSKNTYSIVVGKAGTSALRTSTGNSASAGGVSSISNVVSCPSQKSYGHDSLWAYYQNNGAPTVSATIISTDKKSAGNNGVLTQSPRTGTTYSGGSSLYEGYGAGGSCKYIALGTTFTQATAGYVKITYKGK